MTRSGDLHNIQHSGHRDTELHGDFSVNLSAFVRSVFFTFCESTQRNLLVESFVHPAVATY